MKSSREWRYESTALTIYKTNYYSGSDADIDSTEKYTDDIDLTEYTHAMLDFTFLASDATDDLYLTIYKRGDDSWSGNELGWKSKLTVENSGNESVYHYTIPDIYGPGHYRFGMKRSGSTTTFDIKVEVWRGRTWELLRGS